MMPGFVTLALTLLAASGGQETPTQETAPPAPVEASSGPEWRRFSETPTSTYLLDMASIRNADGGAMIRIARVSKRLEAGDYSHVVDQFGVRCAAGETRVEASSEVGPDGETADSFVADEPWAAAARGSFDAAVKEVACGEMEPNQAPFSSVRAWIDAGRP